MKTKIFPITGLALLVILFACSPKVTVVGDKDNPIAINAEIKIHVYQHAEQDVDDIMDELDEEVPEDSPTSMITKAMSIAQNFGVSTAYAAAPSQADKKAAKKEVVKYFKAALPFLKSGILGEGKDGYVVLINKNPSATKEQITKAIQIADKLNAARKRLYEIAAALTGGDIRLQQEAYSTAFRKKAKKGTWIQRKKGGNWVWVQKK